MLYLKGLIKTENFGKFFFRKFLVSNDNEKDHEKLCVHIRNMHRYLHRVRKEIDNELAKTYRKSEPPDINSNGSYDIGLFCLDNATTNSETPQQPRKRIK